MNKYLNISITNGILSGNLETLENDFNVIEGDIEEMTDKVITNEDKIVQLSNQTNQHLNNVETKLGEVNITLKGLEESDIELAHNLDNLEANVTEMDERLIQLSNNLTFHFPNGKNTTTAAPTIPTTTTTAIPPIMTDSIAKEGKLFLVGGYDPNDGKYTYTSEVVDILDDGVTPCTKQYTFHTADSYPRLAYFDGGVLNKSIILVCGGRCYSTSSGYCGDQTSGTPYRRECYRYEDTGASPSNAGDVYRWTLFTQLAYNRAYHSTVLINENVLWITGGTTPEGRTQTSEFVFTNGSTAEGPLLEVPVESHCTVRLDDDSILFVGGANVLGNSDSATDSTSYGSNTFVYKVSSNEFTEGPRLNIGRSRHGCVVYQSRVHGNRNVVLVAGGSMTTSSNALITELWDFTISNEWETFVELPSGAKSSDVASSIYGPRMVPTPNNDGAILFYDDEFWELYCKSDETCIWHRKTQITNYRRVYQPSMMYIPSVDANCGDD